MEFWPWLVSCFTFVFVSNFIPSVTMETLRQLVEIGLQMGYKDVELQNFVQDEQNRARDERERERSEKREREEKEMQWIREREELAALEHKRKMELLEMEQREVKDL